MNRRELETLRHQLVLDLVSDQKTLISLVKELKKEIEDLKKISSTNKDNRKGSK